MSLSPDNDGLNKAVQEPGIVLTPQQKKSRDHRNLAIALAVGFFVLLIYVVTIAKLGPGVLTHPAE
ncbi:MAG: hypothetical protein P4L76_02955 [Beijerinckiaceae bacterium]|nr:hypothetical protein [Beijerinckiaceae bacterium]